MPCRLFHSIPGPYPLNASSSSQLWQVKMSLDIAKYPSGSKMTPCWDLLLWMYSFIPSTLVNWMCSSFRELEVFICELCAWIWTLMNKGKKSESLNPVNLSSLLKILFLKDSIYLFLERGERREKERERIINVWLPLPHPLLGTWPETQACALTGNQTGIPFICRQALSSTETHQPGLFWKPFKNIYWVLLHAEFHVCYLFLWLLWGSNGKTHEKCSVQSLVSNKCLPL